MSFWPFPKILLDELRSGLECGVGIEVGAGEGRLSHRLADCGIHLHTLDLRAPAELRADLDCSEHAGDAVIVYGGPLTLGGFAVTGHPAHSVISCRGTERSIPGGPSVGPCTIQGPGIVVGGMRGIHSGQLKVTDVDVTGSMMGVASLRLNMNGGSVTACRLAGVAPWGAPAKHKVRNRRDARFSAQYANGQIGLVRLRDRRRRVASANA